MHSQSFKLLLVAFIAIFSFVLAAPLEDNDKRDYGYAAPAVHYVTKYKTINHTKWSTKYKTKYSKTKTVTHVSTKTVKSVKTITTVPYGYQAPSVSTKTLTVTKAPVVSTKTVTKVPVVSTKTVTVSGYIPGKTGTVVYTLPGTTVTSYVHNTAYETSYVYEKSTETSYLEGATETTYVYGSTETSYINGGVETSYVYGSTETSYINGPTETSVSVSVSTVYIDNVCSSTTSDDSNTYTTDSSTSSSATETSTTATDDSNTSTTATDDSNTSTTDSSSSTSATETSATTTDDSQTTTSATEPVTTTTETSTSATTSQSSEPTYYPGDSEWSPQGCYVEPQFSRMFPDQILAEDDLDVEMCLSACKAGGYPYGGVEYGRECWCGSDTSAGTLAEDQDACKSRLCGGDSDEWCGGDNLIIVYKLEPTSGATTTADSSTSTSASASGPTDTVSSTSASATAGPTDTVSSTSASATAGPTDTVSSTSASATADPTDTVSSTSSSATAGPTGPVIHPGAGGYSYSGCNHEPEGGRAFGSSVGADDMTPEKCFDICNSSDTYDNVSGNYGPFKYCALEYGRECWYGNSYTDKTPIADDQCNFGCEGAAMDYFCGGYATFSLYENPTVYKS